MAIVNLNACMKLALLSDIHANLRALVACEAHALAQGATQFALLGDYVGYGAEPVAVVQRIMALQAQGALVLRGNHDDMAVQPPADASTLGASTAQWTHEQLSPAQRAFLASLPLSLRQGPAWLVHASAEAPERWRYVQDAHAATLSLDALREQSELRYVFGGHVHHQSLYYRGSTGGLMRFHPTPGVAVPVPLHRHWLATVGSVGQPRDGDPRAMYALWDVPRALLTFHRVDYDHHAAAAAIRRAGLPDFFAN